ncbi:MAG TPA: ankyrin repeat domain-containing protein [Sphingobacterium sp.]|uniref:ankyrin repeat domain-containing protein n=1 Tax=Sphingobacterium faecium TaxID=34087 RepID=UPI0004E5FD7E|nr:ankyrin repeat domain-containing protein [Sphingobacterium faecium]UXD67912.1 ankyrin repeat domain-containing protein [Sphingobacterium faecium]CDS92348.1 Ankyrin repeat protein [Sphingobacterium sp. PM2-P1-29]HCU45162.1 ankyrin repeat domain-containing protein [Sphingobacterium sp.]
MSLSILEQYIESGNSRDLDLLLTNNPDLILEETSHGISPLLLACYFHKPQIIRVLLQHNQGLNIHEAVAAGLNNYIEAMIKQLPTVVNEISTHGYSALALATHFNKEEAVRILLTHKADPDIPTQNEESLYPLQIALLNKNNAISKLLIEAGADVNTIPSNGQTALHLAAQQGNIELIVLLLENGARIELKNMNNKTASDLAASKGYGDIAEILKEI